VNHDGLDGQNLLAQATDCALTARETGLTQEAIDRQLFGAPFYFYRGEPFGDRIVSINWNRLLLRAAY
jgi:2-hydroxychromene-2-carboxylate isomerase